MNILSAKLPLVTTGFDYALVDEDLFHELSQYRWTVDKAHSGWHTNYVRRRPYINGVRLNFYLHREVLRLRGIEIPPGYEVDHINRDGLDNRTSNLRLASKAENRRNRGKQKNSTSRFKGVQSINNGGWVARIGAGRKGERLYLGYFTNELDAAVAYNEAALKLFGEFAVLNDLGGDAL